MIETRKVLSVRKYEAGYEVRTELIDAVDCVIENVEIIKF